MGNVAACLACIGPKEEPCEYCKYTGVCPPCKGTGFIEERDRQILKTEMRKTIQGNMVPETITKLAKEQIPCMECGGRSNQFRGNMSGASPYDHGVHSPTKSNLGTGKCKFCKGTGKIVRQPSPAVRRQLFRGAY